MKNHASFVDEKYLNKECKAFLSEWKSNKTKFPSFMANLFLNFYPCTQDPIPYLLRYTEEYYLNILSELVDSIIPLANSTQSVI